MSMMAGAGQLDSPTCEVNASNSPRFDINEFLKTPKDATEEQYFNFATFNTRRPAAAAAATATAGAGAAPPAAAAAAEQADFSTLLATINDGPSSFDHPGVAAADSLIAFDEIDADTLFSAPGSHVHDCSSVFNPLVEPVPSYVPSPGHRLPYTWAYMLEDLPRPDDRSAAACETTASTSGGAHLLPVGAAAQQADWGMAGPTQQQQQQQPQQHFGQAQQQQQLQCASCQILRRIIHSNGVQDTKLEIHGCDGQSYHAVLQTRFCIDDGFPSSFEQQMVEFPVGNAEYVKQFLLQYSLLRRKEGFVLKHDSLTSHGSGGLGMAMSSERVMGGNSGCMPKQMGHMVLPDVLCTSSAEEEHVLNLSKNLIAQNELSVKKTLSVTKMQASNSSIPDLDFSNSGCAYGKASLGDNKIHNSGSIDSTGNADINVGPAKPPKSNAAAQRERTGKLKMMDLAQHFHLPINAAAKELGICPTVLKKYAGVMACADGLIASIERIIATLEQTIAEGAVKVMKAFAWRLLCYEMNEHNFVQGFLVKHNHVFSKHHHGVNKTSLHTFSLFIVPTSTSPF